jgi:hypothetical protein
MPTTVPKSTTQTLNATKIATTAANIGGMAATVIAGINDTKQRAAFSNNLSLLNNDEQAALNKQLAAASSNDERLRIITDTLTNLQAKRIDLLTQADSSKEAQTRTNTYIAAGVFVMVAIGMIVLIYKKD